MIRHSVLAVALTLLAARAVAKQQAPEWLVQAAAAPMAKLATDEPALVVLDEEQVTVRPSGPFVVRLRRAVRVLATDGRTVAEMAESFRPETDWIADIHAWRIDPGGETTVFGRHDAIEVLATPEDVYNEVRTLRLSGSAGAVVGSVFGCELTIERTPPYAQIEWAFQWPLPVAVSRLVLVLPEGWHAEAHAFHHAPIEARASGPALTWELTDLPPIKDEPASPPVAGIAARLGVSIAPPDPAPPGAPPAFRDWAAVSRWLWSLSAAAAQPTDAMRQLALSLTTGASTDLERAAAIARRAQAVNYVSIQTGIGRGGGYWPHSAADVLAKNYGDCKDKVALTRALLSAVGLQSWPVSIYSGDPTRVDDRWPTPQQFNHAIVAVKVPDDASAPAILATSPVGRVLLIDPTDVSVPPGELPLSDQGSLALIAAPEGGALVRTPLALPEANMRRSTTTWQLAADGSAVAQLHFEHEGARASRWRAWFRATSETERTHSLEHVYAADFPGAAISKVAVADESSGRIIIDADMQAPRLGQRTSGMLIATVVAAGPREVAPLACGRRSLPIAIDAAASVDTTHLRLPPGHVADDLPEPVALDTPFGSYSRRCERGDGEVIVESRLSLRSTTVPAADCAAVDAFFSRIDAARRVSIVLLAR